MGTVAILAQEKKTLTTQVETQKAKKQKRERKSGKEKTKKRKSKSEKSIRRWFQKSKNASSFNLIAIFNNQEVDGFLGLLAHDLVD